MISSIGLAGVTADVVILVVLVAAVLSQRMSLLARLLIATFAFVCAWLLTAVFGAVRAQGWMMFTCSAVMVVSIAVLLGTVHVWAQAGEGGEGDGEHRGDQGGGGPPLKPDAPQPGGGGNDPSWWPEFERQLAFYVAERDGEEREPAVLPAGAGVVRDDPADSR